MTELKPCPNPWCESTDIGIESDSYDSPPVHYAVCNACGNTGPARDTEESAAAAWNTRAAVPVEAGNMEDMAAWVVSICEKRGWSSHWTHRGAHLRLEASELIEAIRGKHGNPTDEAGDVLLVLMSITEYAGIPFSDVIRSTQRKLAYLEDEQPYVGEERLDQAQEASDE